MSPAAKFGMLILSVGALFTGLYVFGFSTREVHKEKGPEETVAKAVRVLPEGTEEAWIAYVDRRVAAAIQRRGDNLQVVTWMDYVFKTSTFVFRNMPYSISCMQPELGGGSVKFGQENDVRIFGIMNPSRTEDPEPPLGVHAQSIAGQRAKQ
ncbi:MAG: hypothetical protein EXQ88_02150 [Alphaproteobacteria bacterium]|nr:hypothetical protein [Alphaproteobacteria bacterium]